MLQVLKPQLQVLRSPGDEDEGSAAAGWTDVNNEQSVGIMPFDDA